MSANLFDHAERLQEAQAAARRGMKQADDNADKTWKTVMLDLLHQVCLTHQRFTSDDIFDLYEALKDAPKTHENRAFGPVILLAKRRGWCLKTDRTVPSRRKELHASPRAIWISRLV